LFIFLLSTLHCAVLFCDKMYDVLIAWLHLHIFLVSYTNVQLQLSVGLFLGQTAGKSSLSQILFWIRKTLKTVPIHPENFFDPPRAATAYNLSPDKSTLNSIYTPWAIKKCHFYFYDNFGRWGPTSVFLSLLDSEINCRIR